ncbi:MAG TPA: haloacid dehalogenase-like hydrolase [Myxococcota bacterium]|nr:haloacid dehalogenase-like hydrolase [Myxococcota bacterium]
MIALLTAIAVGLPAGGWYPKNREALESMLKAVKPGDIATFDWDNTSAFGDIGENVFFYQLERMEMLLTPSQVHELMPEPLRAKMVAAYVALKSGKAVIGDATHKEFRETCAGLYAKLEEDPNVPRAYTYAWIGYWLAGMTAEQVRALGAKVAPLVTKPQQEIKDLMSAITAAGARVYVISASQQELVRGAAATFGYPLPADHIYGLRNAMAEGKYLPRYEPAYPITWRQGKADLIDTVLPKGRHIFAAGDANTDVEMLRHAEYRLVIDRHPDGDLAKLVQEPRVILQARDEKTGAMVPRPRT